MLRRLVFIATLVVGSISTSAAQANNPAPTPPMGWNSWDSYGLTITEQQFRANVAVLRDKLLPYGWRYAVIDEGWFFENPQDRPKPETLIYAIDGHGRYVPVPARFPSAVGKPTIVAYAGGMPKLKATIEDTSFRPLADWVHAQGLLFGIHIVHGIPRASTERNMPIAHSSFHAQDAADTSDVCPWDPTNWGVKDNAAGQAWYDSLIEQYAEWGVDLLKVDCIVEKPYKLSEIRQIRRAIDKERAKTGHKMVLSLSEGPADPSHEAEFASLSNMWRISDDFWDVWSMAQKPGETFPQPLKGQFDRLATWSKFDLKPGQWPDADMLPFGELRPVAGWGKPRHTRLTPDEQKTVMTLWSIAQSPLILGANLTMLDDATLQLLTNRGVLEVDQHASVRGKPLPAFSTGALRVWRAKLEPGLDYTPTVAVALFNLGDAPMKVDRSRTELGFWGGAKGRSAELFDVWANKTLWRSDRVKLTIPPHGCVLLEGN